MSDCIETALRHLAADDNLTRLEAELAGKDDDTLDVVDGYLVNADGEVVGYAERPGFAIDSDEKAEWVLEKRADAESRIVALKAKREAILANIDREIRHHEGRVKALDYRFGAELEQFARTRLTGKRRTWTCAYGSVSFKRQAARWRWTPDGKAAALEYAKKHMPALVRVKVTEDVPFEHIEKFMESIHAQPERLYDESAPEFVRDLARVVEFVPEGERVTISTGVGK